MGSPAPCSAKAKHTAKENSMSFCLHFAVQIPGFGFLNSKMELPEIKPSLIRSTLDPSNFFCYMESQREKIPDMSRKDYIPIFLTNFLRDKISKTAVSGLERSRSRSPTSSRSSKKPRLDHSPEGNVQGFEGVYFLPAEIRLFVLKILNYAVQLKNTDGIGLDSKEFARLFCQEIEFPCLELLWVMDVKFGLMSLTTYLMSIKSEAQLEYFKNQFLSLCFSPSLLEEKTRGRGTEILQDFLRSILVAGYCNPESSERLICLKETAIEILIKIRERLVATDMNSIAHQNIHLVVAMFRTVRVTACLKKTYFAEELTRILRLEPKLTMEEILQQQEKIAETGMTNPSMAETILLFIGDPQTKKDIIATLEKNLEEPESLNWENLLGTITVWEQREFSSLRLMALLKATIKKMLTIGLGRQGQGHKGSLLSAFILARHCCLIAPKKFNRYEEWYTSQFQKELETCARELKAFSFLIVTLSELVPTEPTCFLQVHAMYPPYIPPGGDEIWAAYLADVKSRITEYNEVEEAMEFEPNLNPVDPIQNDVDLAIKTYEKVKSIPNKVKEMLMFRKQYYLESFLPALIKKPIIASMSDARLRLIETLNAAGKIPQKQYAEYKAQQKP